MPIQDILSNLRNPNKRFNRINLGGFISSTILKWRITDLILIVILLVLYFILYDIKPFHRQFYINDLTISHPFAEVETVGNTALFVYSTWIPLAIVIVVSLVLTTPQYKLYNTYVAVIGLVLSVLITSVTTDVLKNWIGRLRPDFLARCIPEKSTPINQLVSIEVCTSDNLGLLEDGFRTTPSGHSSLSFAGLSFLALFLLGQLQATNTKVGSWRTLIGAAPFLMAAYIALSRTRDYRHHFVDVLIGSVLGLGIGFWSYLRLFPWISHERSYVNLIIIEEEDEENNSKLDQENEANYTRLTDV
ncbi:Dpp3 protein [Candida orthopsilosis Co 90-125]|uniref:Dpp3 protein n=1 Tax=Candida orthopsilosis (strain 90-125) TaxID=1136231 RepID=H8XAW2_CANO9|nr:Dpp3 protein [Candida orthopsilosis Co 90-125]CCG25210.1 Dpp3 protein [Candida orthopsilosis Co 90-125]